MNIISIIYLNSHDTVTLNKHLVNFSELVCVYLIQNDLSFCVKDTCKTHRHALLTMLKYQIILFKINNIHFFRWVFILRTDLTELELSKV